MMRLSDVMLAAVLGLSASVAFGQAAPADSANGPYKVVKTAKVGGEGGFDYVACGPGHPPSVRGSQRRGRPRLGV